MPIADALPNRAALALVTRFPLAVAGRRLAIRTPVGIPTFGAAQRLITVGAQRAKLALQLTHAAFEIGKVDGPLAVDARWGRRAAIRVAAGGMLALGARQRALALSFMTAQIGGAVTRGWLALNAGRRPAVAFSMQPLRILTSESPLRVPFEFARERRARNVLWRTHVTFNFARGPALVPAPVQRRAEKA